MIGALTMSRAIYALYPRSFLEAMSFQNLLKRGDNPHRSKMSLSTSAGRMNDGLKFQLEDEQHIITASRKKSLGRLQLDYVDIQQ